MGLGAQREMNMFIVYCNFYFASVFFFNKMKSESDQKMFLCYATRSTFQPLYLER